MANNQLNLFQMNNSRLLKSRRWLLFGAAFVMLFAACNKEQESKYKYETVKGDLTEARIYTLDNGLTVYLSVNNEEPRIQTYIAVRTGSKNDPAETTGLAHYLEHLMFKGTDKFGTTDPAAEKVFLDDIEARYEHYRTLTDPEARRVAYHEIDSVSQLAAQYFIPKHRHRPRQPQSLGSHQCHALPDAPLRHTDYHRYAGALEESQHYQHQKLLQQVVPPQ